MERLRRIAVTRLEIYILTLHFQHDEMTHCCRSLPATPTLLNRYATAGGIGKEIAWLL